MPTGKELADSLLAVPIWRDWSIWRSVVENGLVYGERWAGPQRVWIRTNRGIEFELRGWPATKAEMDEFGVPEADRKPFIPPPDAGPAWPPGLP